MNRPRVIVRSATRVVEAPSAQIAMAVVAAGGVVLLARVLEFDRPPSIDRRIRQFARRSSMDETRLVLAPLFAIGLPATCITIAHATSYWLHRRRRPGGPAIVRAAWLAWVVHRAIKLGYRRERPLRPDVRRRTESYPSGHTTGTTALAVTLAEVLRRQGLISTRRAAAIAVGAPAVMGAYRVIADDHWATDVVGGWMLGGAIALACVGASRLTAVPRELESMSPPTRPRAHPERSSSSA